MLGHGGSLPAWAAPGRACVSTGRQHAPPAGNRQGARWNSRPGPGTVPPVRRASARSALPFRYEQNTPQT
ncbi:hypothetical protein DGo_CA2944 [Deinococcus gobiensis I-0]|uniref:Uncharacterized protein n=1 Tax=Deinococcus gobiensis (strain DSM 21396 / JCM 16679 / CGMCC 1.7299 / I-0) TaxID=745776 RepID=H8GW06_DEIGI|nr:hypothetical protein DGo_CA2944 [Deinococcus gobiensis I-0]